MIAVLVIWPALARSEPQHLEGLSGRWLGQAVEVRWRKGIRTHYQPEVIVFVENRIDKRVVVEFHWTPRICAGQRMKMNIEESLFVDNLYAGSTPIHGALRPGEWDAYLFPYGDFLFEPTKQAPGAACVTTLGVRSIVGGETIDRAVIEVPSPTPPPRKQEPSD